MDKPFNHEKMDGEVFCLFGIALKRLKVNFCLGSFPRQTQQSSFPQRFR